MNKNVEVQDPQTLQSRNKMREQILEVPHRDRVVTERVLQSIFRIRSYKITFRLMTDLAAKMDHLRLIRTTMKRWWGKYSCVNKKINCNRRQILTSLVAAGEVGMRKSIIKLRVNNSHYSSSNSHQQNFESLGLAPSLETTKCLLKESVRKSLSKIERAGSDTSYRSPEGISRFFTKF